MTETGRRSWGLEEGDWVERRHRRGTAGRSASSDPLSPDYLARDGAGTPGAGRSSGGEGGAGGSSGGGGGFVRRTFQDHRPQTMAPAAVMPSTTVDAVSAYEDDNETDPAGGGRWVLLSGVPRDACLEVREFVEAHFGPTKVMFVPPAVSAATGASSSHAALGGFGGGGGVGFVQRLGVGDGITTGADGRGAYGALQDCYLCFESAVHAQQAVHAGSLRFHISRGTADTVAHEKLAYLFPEAAAAAGIQVPRGVRRKQLRHQREAYEQERRTYHDTYHSRESGPSALYREDEDDDTDDDDGSSKMEVYIIVQWCPDQNILPVLSRESATMAPRGHEQQQQQGRATSHPSTSQSPHRGDSLGGRDALDDDPLPPGFIQSAAAPSRVVENTNVADDPAAAGGSAHPLASRSLGSQLNMSVLALFFASAARPSLWLWLPRAILLVLWTLSNLFSWLLLGRRPSGVHAAARTASQQKPVATADRNVPGGDTSSVTSSSSSSLLSRLSSSSPPSSLDVTLLHGRNASMNARGMSKGDSTRADPFRVLWRQVVALSDGDVTADGQAGMPSLSPMRLLSSCFYAVFGAVAPSPSELDLVLWSWWRLRSPHVQRNYRMLRQRLRRLGRAFSSGRDTTVGVYGNLNEPFYRYGFEPSAQAFGWDGAFADFRLFDDDYYYRGQHYGNASASNPRQGKASHSTRATVERGRDGRGQWLASPEPLRVLLTWRPAASLTRYSALSFWCLLAALIYLVLGGRKTLEPPLEPYV